MRKLTLLSFALLSGVISNAQNFCGSLSMTISKEGKAAPATMYLCDGNFLVRYEMDANGQKNKIDYLVLASGKKYMKYDLMGKELGVELSDADVKSNLSVAKVAKTGEKSQILGFDCELVKIQGSDGNITEAWITENGPVDFGTFSSILKDDASALAIAKLGIKGLPVKSVTKDKNGFEVSSFRIEGIQNTPVDKFLFEAPKVLTPKSQVK
jgi:hypothetical protein